MGDPQPTIGDDALQVVLPALEMDFMAIGVQFLKTNQEIQVIPFVRRNPEFKFNMTGYLGFFLKSDIKNSPLIFCGIVGYRPFPVYLFKG